MRFQPSRREILRKNALYSHLIGKLRRFHGAWNQGSREREWTWEINRTAGCGCGAFMRVNLSSRGGWGGQETSGPWRLGEFFNRCFLNLTLVIKKTTTTKKHCSAAAKTCHHPPFISVPTFSLKGTFALGSESPDFTDTYVVALVKVGIVWYFVIQRNYRVYIVLVPCHDRTASLEPWGNPSEISLDSIIVIVTTHSFCVLPFMLMRNIIQGW